MTNEEPSMTAAMPIESLPCGCYRREGDGRWFRVDGCIVHREVGSVEIADLMREARIEIERWKRLEQYQVDCRVILERALWEIKQHCGATSSTWVDVLTEIKQLASDALEARP